MTSTSARCDGISLPDQVERQGMAYPSDDIRSVMPATLGYDPKIAAPLRQSQASEYTRSNVHALNAPQARTREQIIAECQARYDEMQLEAAKPERQFPCSTCRWKARGYRDACRQPLIIGIRGQPVDNWDADHSAARLDTRLCGPEKALWEPRQSWWARLVEWVLSWLI